LRNIFRVERVYSLPRMVASTQLTPRYNMNMYLFAQSFSINLPKYADVYLSLLFGPKTTQDRPRCPQEGPRSLQEGPKTAKKCGVLKPSQNATFFVQRNAQTGAQEAPKRAQDRPK